MKPLSGKEFEHILSCLDSKPVSSLRDTGIETLMRVFSLSNSEAYRICILLDRDIMLMHLLEECAALGIEVTTPFDDGYPARLKENMGALTAPPLFFFGDIGIMNEPCAGLTGTAGIKTPDMVKDNLGALIPALAENGLSLITSGGHGACFHARRIALDTGARLITVANGRMCDSVCDELHKSNAADGAELIISPYNPFAAFSPDNQPLVNRIIYCQSLAAFVSTLPPKNNEAEVLRKKLCPYLYAFDTPENASLIARGFAPVRDITGKWVRTKSDIWFSSESEQLSFL